MKRPRLFRPGKGQRRYLPDEAAAAIAERDQRIEDLEALVRMLDCSLREEAGETKRLRTELTATRARLANANSVTVTQVGWRDTTDPEDQVTVPGGIDVRPLWDAADEGLLNRRNPAHVPAWAKTQPLPVAGGTPTATHPGASERTGETAVPEGANA